MRAPRRRRGFERAGAVDAGALDLPAAQRRELLVSAAWRSVAGTTIARRAPAVGVRRGVLELRVPDGQWARTLTDLLPRLAARLAASHPELRVRRFRLLREGEPSPEAQELPAVPEGEVVDEGPSSTSGRVVPSLTAPPPRPVRALHDRLRDAAAAYLERKAQRP